LLNGWPSSWLKRRRREALPCRSRALSKRGDESVT
jgi:hypothetical protein